MATVECPSPYHRTLLERKRLLTKYLGPYVGGRMRVPRLTNSEITLSLVIFDNGVEVGRFSPYAACPFCWAVLLNAMGFRPEDLAAIAPVQAQKVFGNNYKWVNAALEGKRIRKRATALERDIRLGQAAAMEVLKQLGIVKEPPEGG